MKSKGGRPKTCTCPEGYQLNAAGDDCLDKIERQTTYFSLSGGIDEIERTRIQSRIGKNKLLVKGPDIQLKFIQRDPPATGSIEVRLSEPVLPESADPDKNMRTIVKDHDRTTDNSRTLTFNHTWQYDYGNGNVDQQKNTCDITFNPFVGNLDGEPYQVGGSYACTSANLKNDKEIGPKQHYNGPLMFNPDRQRIDEWLLVVRDIQFGQWRLK